MSAAGEEAREQTVIHLLNCPVLTAEIRDLVTNPDLPMSVLFQIQARLLTVIAELQAIGAITWEVPRDDHGPWGAWR